MRVLVANPRGFCAGVDRAIAAVEQTLQIVGPPLYVYHEIVHNQHVVGRLQAEGVIFVDDLAYVPEQAVLIYSAHGVSPKVREQARARRLQTIDATCPLVTKVHLEAIKYAQAGYSVLLIGHARHDEVVGTLGEVPTSIQLIQTVDDAERITIPDPARVAYITQTTLSLTDVKTIVDCLRIRFPKIVSPPKEDICYATQNRQQALAELAKDAHLVLVIASANSSNSQRLAELASQQPIPVYLINSVADLHPAWFRLAQRVTITAGASTPEAVVQEVLQHLSTNYGATIEEQKNPPETVRFPLPGELATLSVA